MALALLLICLLVTVVWLTRGEQAARVAIGPGGRLLTGISIAFFVCLFVEGILGSQVREQTDILARNSESSNREDWTVALSGTTVYLVHRSFSWVLLVAATGILFFSKRGGSRPLGPKLIFGIVVGMMVLGLIMARLAVYEAVQVLHVGLTAILLAVTWRWLLDLYLALRTKPASP